jgi:hypothetical protein
VRKNAGQPGLGQLEPAFNGRLKGWAAILSEIGKRP